ncbi:MAG: TFIIB-type zinc ribbon-containing protein [Bacilli bacterium]|nr:TFIIB-type zinc ribbon-containing protein [Bacilli bacterium]
MEENKYICPDCGSEMIAVYDKPALNLNCPKCGCMIATTKWEEIDLDDTIYQISIMPNCKNDISTIKLLSKITGENFIKSRDLANNGGLLSSGTAIQVLELRKTLIKAGIDFKILPEFKY